MKKQNYLIISDPGHSWLRVPPAHLAELGIVERISGYSHFSLDYKFVHLEEDCDAPVFYTELLKRKVFESIAEFKNYLIEEEKPQNVIRLLPEYEPRLVPIRSGYEFEEETEDLPELVHSDIGKGESKYLAGINILTVVDNSGKISEETRCCLLEHLTFDFARKNLDLCISHGYDELQSSDVYLCSYGNINIVFQRRWKAESKVIVFGFPVIRPQEQNQ